MEIILSKKSFAELSEKVHAIISKQNWFEQHGREMLHFFIRVVFFALGIVIFAQHGVIFKIVGMIIASFFFYGIGITGTHETRHDSFLNSNKWNKIWAYFFSDFWSGQSNEWWHQRHVVLHHPFTNVQNKDKQIFYFPWINPYIYFFMVPYLVSFWLFIFSCVYLWKKWGKLTLYLLAQTAGYVFHILIFYFILDNVGLAILSTFIMRSLFAPVFVHVAVFNHVALDNPAVRPPWLPHQTRTTRNLKQNWFLKAMGGNAFIECHLEHHLFPKLSNRMLAKIRPTVMEHIKKDGYLYIEETYFQCLQKCIKGYHTIFKTSPIEGI